MDKKDVNYSGLSRKAKLNIFVAIFLVFIILTILSSINPIMEIVEKRKKIEELEDKLNWIRNNNIELLALEKSLYHKEAIEIEARKQFNMTKDSEENYFVVVNEKEAGKNKNVYSNTNLWENIKIFYNREIIDN